jgi:hypothetical protein
MYIHGFSSRGEEEMDRISKERSTFDNGSRASGGPASNFRDHWSGITSGADVVDGQETEAVACVVVPEGNRGLDAIEVASLRSPRGIGRDLNGMIGIETRAERIMAFRRNRK